MNCSFSISPVCDWHPYSDMPQTTLQLIQVALLRNEPPGVRKLPDSSLRSERQDPTSVCHPEPHPRHETGAALARVVMLSEAKHLADPRSARFFAALRMTEVASACHPERSEGSGLQLLA